MKHNRKTLKEYTEKLFGKEIANMSYKELNKMMKEKEKLMNKIQTFFLQVEVKDEVREWFESGGEIVVTFNKDSLEITAEGLDNA